VNNVFPLSHILLSKREKWALAETDWIHTQPNNLHFYNLLFVNLNDRMPRFCHYFWHNNITGISLPESQQIQSIYNFSYLSTYLPTYLPTYLYLRTNLSLPTNLCMVLARLWILFYVSEINLFIYPSNHFVPAGTWLPKIFCYKNDLTNWQALI